MRELSLYTGAGGGVLGTKLLNWQAVGYVEKNEYCQKVLRQRIDDGIFDEAPIFSDIDAFISEGFAQQYQGMVDVITAGFPCQPFTNSGTKQGEDDDRNKWPATWQCIRIIRPEFVFLENSSNLLSFDYFGQILSNLAQCGYDVRWRLLSAAEMGAPHKRNRLWAVAHASGARSKTGISKAHRRNKGHTAKPFDRRHRQSRGPGKSIWAPEPELGRVADGVACRVDRLKCIGNGQVPEVVATAWEILTEGII